MRTKKVNRYYCDFCRKAGCGKAAMIKHEKHCTANPQRECRMCQSRKRDYKALRQGLYAVREANPLVQFNEDYFQVGEKAIAWLEQQVDGCPACMLAVLRQAKAYCASNDWDYKEACEEWWKFIRDEQMENEERATYYPSID